MIKIEIFYSPRREAMYRKSKLWRIERIQFFYINPTANLTEIQNTFSQAEDINMRNK